MISVVIPVYNEEKNIAVLHKKIVEVMRSLGGEYEIIFIDDGSTDNTFNAIRELAPVAAFRFARNCGQTGALALGLQKARGNILVTLDGDLENDPQDIPKLVAKLGEGYDIVSGWRQSRWHGQFFSRRMPSIIANWIISYFTGAKLHDHGCTLKAYRREALSELKLFGETHRMIAAYAKLFNGAKLAEIPVNYKPRRFGSSKYGPLRSFKVVLDLLAVYFFYKYGHRPMHFFGGIGFFSFFFGFLTFLWMIYLKYFEATSFIKTPLPVLAAIFVIIGIQFILMGLLAELLIKHSGGSQPHLLKEEIRNS